MKWKWDNLGWDSTEPQYAPGFLKYTIYKYDKLQHFVLGGLFVVIGCLFKISTIISLLISMGFWFIWEIINALGPEELDCHGFSWRDLVCSWFGALLIYCILRCILGV